MSIEAYAKNGYGVSGMYSPEAGDDKLSPKQLELKKVCRDFEAVLTSTILKQGLQNAEEMGKTGSEEEDNGCKRMKEIAHEQIATFIGQSGLMGLGNFLFNNMKDRIVQQEVANAAKQQTTASE